MNVLSGPPWVSRALNLLGFVVFVFAFIDSGLVEQYGAWLGVVTGIAFVAWPVVVFLPRGTNAEGERIPRPFPWLRPAVGLLGVLAGSLALAPTQSLSMIAVAIILVLLMANVADSPWVAIAVAALAAAVVPFGCLIAGSPIEAVFAYESTIVVWVLIGYARRQARIGEVQRRELAEQAIAAREEHARAAVLADRQAAARDIHDVLAHSLGGLVIQLDAVEALLESGQTADATRRVAQARQLAADGLGDARRAVATLRSPDDVQAPAVPLPETVEQLVEVHRSLGGQARLETSGELGSLPDDVSTAFERALQEALSNARKHAPGAEVEVMLARGGGEVQLVVSNPVPAGSADSAGASGAGASALARSGGSHGLAGMAERFSALAGGAVSAEESGGRFVVTARAADSAPSDGSSSDGPSSAGSVAAW